MIGHYKRIWALLTSLTLFGMYVVAAQMSGDKKSPGAVRVLLALDAKTCLKATRQAQEKKMCQPDPSIIEYCEVLSKNIQEATDLGASEIPWLVFKGDSVLCAGFQLWLKCFSDVRGFQIRMRIYKTDPTIFSVKIAWLDDKGLFSVTWE